MTKSPLLKLCLAIILLTLANIVSLEMQLGKITGFHSNIILSVIISSIWFIVSYLKISELSTWNLAFALLFYLGAITTSMFFVYILVPKDLPTHYWSGVWVINLFYHALELIVCIVLVTFSRMLKRHNE